MQKQFGTAQSGIARPQHMGDLVSTAALALILSSLVIGCTPTVRVEAPKEPIKIDLNITADVRVKVENAVENTIDSNPDIF